MGILPSYKTTIAIKSSTDFSEIFCTSSYQHIHKDNNMMKCIAIFAFLATLSLSSAGGHCDGFTEGGKCYFPISDRPLDQDRARTACDDMGGELATIKNKVVFDAAKLYVKENYEYPQNRLYAVYWL